MSARLVAKWYEDARIARADANYGLAAGSEDCADELEAELAAVPDSHAANVAMVSALNDAYSIEPHHDDEYIYDTLPTSGVAAAYFAARAAIAKATGE